MKRLVLIYVALLLLAGVVAWLAGHTPAVVGVVVGAVASLIPTSIPLFAMRNGQSLVNPTMLAMTLRMLLAGAIVLGALITFEKTTVQVFAIGLVVSYVISLVMETIFFAQSLGGSSVDDLPSHSETTTATA